LAPFRAVAKPAAEIYVARVTMMALICSRPTRKPVTTPTDKVRARAASIPNHRPVANLEHFAGVTDLNLVAVDQDHPAVRRVVAGDDLMRVDLPAPFWPTKA
jgi:hypothetical protein